MPSWGSSLLRRPQYPALGASHFLGSTRTEKRTYYTRYFPSRSVYKIRSVGCLAVAESNPRRGFQRSQRSLWRPSWHGLTPEPCFWTTILSMWREFHLQLADNAIRKGERQGRGTEPHLPGDHLHLPRRGRAPHQHKGEHCIVLSKIISPADQSRASLRGCY